MKSKFIKCKHCETCVAYRHYERMKAATKKWEAAHRAERNSYMREYRQKNKNKLLVDCKSNTNQ